MSRQSSIIRGNMLLMHIGAILTVAAWGSSFVMTKVLLQNGLGPVEAFVYRILLAYICLLLISHRRFLSRTWKDEVILMIAGMCSGSIYFIAENTALDYTSTTNVSLITTTSPLITALLVGFVYKNEKPKRGVIIGSLIAMMGVGFVIFNSSMDVTICPLGDMLALAAAISWAVYSIVVRRLYATYDVMYITRKMFFYGLVTAIPFMALKGEPLRLDLLASPVVWGNLLGLGFICSILAFLMWNEAIKRLGAITASNYLYFQPIVTLLVAFFFLGEAITIVGIAGCALILLGVFLSDYLSRPRRG